jgi:thiosulfate/3-mercaptopyruvate sulfurtransferase
MQIIDVTEAIRLFAQEGTVFVDTRPAEDWAASTIPGAICLNVYDYFIPESTETGIHGMAAGALAAFQRLKIDQADRVVFFETATGMRSPRGLWFHELCGLVGGTLLDGGFQGWCAAGGAASPGEGVADAVVQDDGVHCAALRRDLVASTEDVLSGRSKVLDSRRAAEWDGSYVHACCARAGRITDAQLLFYEDLLVSGHYRPKAEIVAIAAAAGFVPSDDIILYCHRGARAATAFYALRRAGFNTLRIYTGSWHEWASNPSLPIVEGSGTIVHR